MQMNTIILLGNTEGGNKLNAIHDAHPRYGLNLDPYNVVNPKPQTPAITHKLLFITNTHGGLEMFQLSVSSAWKQPISAN